jgi:hypothetical protein
MNKAICPDEIIFRFIFRWRKFKDESKWINTDFITIRGKCGGLKPLKKDDYEERFKKTTIKDMWDAFNITGDYIKGYYTTAVDTEIIKINCPQAIIDELTQIKLVKDI